ncbi:MAG: aconitate hydratase [Candidatus Brocadiia bacterium]
MSDNLTYKILKDHCVEGTPAPGEEFGIRIDQTLTQDATGTAAYLQFEAMGVDRVKTGLSVSYVDHNTLQSGFENADDHRYLQSVAGRYGIVFSRPGNGICHQVHLERFGVPGKTLLGSDSHTPTGGALGMIAIGVGGQDVACAMASLPFRLTGPEVVRIRLTGKLQPWVSAKDVILELLRRLSVKSGVGKVFEYTGPGLKTLDVPARATITNMGTELGLTTSVFPSDEHTRDWLRRQQREESFTAQKPDPDAEYDETIEIDLSTVEPLVALPHNPDNVVTVKELEGKHVDQVCIGSCTNSSLRDLSTVGQVLEGRSVHPEVSLTISPGSQQVLEIITERSVLGAMVEAGARILEAACGPCIGMGQSPGTDAVTLRTFNRNFEGRTGTQNARCHLCSPETAVAAALHGEITDPRTLGDPPEVEEPDQYPGGESLIIYPPEDGSDIEVKRGPNIKPIPKRQPMPEMLEASVLLKVGDNITTDHIMPAGSKILPLRSNIPAISEHVFESVDPEFPGRARERGGGFIVGGENYGQGSSREHAALAPMHLGVIAVIAKSFARIHRSNLINFGILPLTFANPGDYDELRQNDILAIIDLRAGLEEGKLAVENITGETSFEVLCDLSERERKIVTAGGRLNMIE